MLRATSRLQALSRTFDTRALTPRPHSISTSSTMSANMSYISAKDACPRKYSLNGSEDGVACQSAVLQQGKSLTVSHE